MFKILPTIFLLALIMVETYGMVNRIESPEELIGENHMGYQVIQSRIERLNPIICHSSIGAVPGKMTETGSGFFSYNYKEYVCNDSEPIQGKRISNEGEVPEECEGKAFVTREDVKVYSVIASSRHGEIPGKAFNASEAFYGYEKEQYRSDDFDWVC